MKITYNSFIFNLLAEEQINLPHYKGSTLRGAFGVAFKRVACALKRQNCTDCLLRTKCIYSQMFETNADGESPLGRVETVPRPFVIVPPETDNTVFEQNSEIKFTLTLIGRATEYLPYFVYAFQELGKMGIGSGRGKYTLLSVISENDGELIYSHDTQTLHSPQKNELDLGDAVSWFIEQDGEPSQSEVTLMMLTPVRIKFKRRYVRNLEFHILIRQLLRRMFLLWYLHGEFDKAEYEQIKDYHKNAIAIAEKVQIKNSNIYWYDWQRYSNRQKTRMNLGGLLGEITYCGNVTPFLPFLRAGEILHVGKNTTFGLGKYRVI